MRRAESVVDVDLLAARELMREVAIVGLFFCMEAQILEQDRLAGLERRDHPAGDIADAIGREFDLLSERRCSDTPRPA